MSRGLGATQQGILVEIERHVQEDSRHYFDGGSYLSSRPESWSLTIAQLAERLDRSPRQIRTAVHALAKRQLVYVVKTSVGQKWIGECVCGADNDDNCSCYFQEMPIMGLRVFTPAGRASQLNELHQERGLEG